MPEGFTNSAFSGAKLKLRGIVLHDGGIALNSVTGETFRLVGSAFSLARLLVRGACAPDLLSYLLATYDVDEARARRDLEAFLDTLKEMHWMEAE